uniref:ABC transmembrane type-1 domain-containing protein n=1 Tax=Chromera velia CCMP2878 TaxID=1169474 RepID=A0A0G4HSX9_9ALVE|eukprot:Cvel_1334.t1-p1 / transcript=Cvel_1334.t1 / gene=Cvel_1334 / organism=Chromera_velia_CCMP2878 / gene_product=ATP-binding cassette sub-family C member 8, putative / transcript_product=ATP-binding cassette sub-family C member 8, putative / location=Cvel_scaffold45:145041-153030(-) / protein_length=2309 / sequence_SO=supercontig / SO=protein_coding / is_pseudo=false
MSLRKERSLLAQEQQGLPSQKEKGSFSRCADVAFLSWVTPLLRKGNRGRIDLSDVPPAPREHSAETVDEIFQREFAQSNGSIGRALMKGFGHRIWLSIAFTLPYIAASHVVPFIVKWFLEFLRDEGGEDPQLWKGFVLAGALALSLALSNWSLNVALLYQMRFGVSVRTAAVMAVMRKSLRLSLAGTPNPLSASATSKETAASTEKKKEGGTDETAAGSSEKEEEAAPQASGRDAPVLISIDADRLFFAAVMFPWTFLAPIYVAVTLGLMFWLVGWRSALVAGVVLLGVLSFTGWAVFAMGRSRRCSVAAAQKRLNAQAEILEGIREVKSHGWEALMTRRLLELRSEEVKAFRNFQLLQSLSRGLQTTVPVAVLAGVFITQMLADGGNICLPWVFTVLALVNLLRVPALFWPLSLFNSADGIAALKRLKSFLNAPESPRLALPYVPLPPNAPPHGSPPHDPISSKARAAAPLITNDDPFSGEMGGPQLPVGQDQVEEEGIVLAPGGVNYLWHGSHPDPSPVQASIGLATVTPKMTSQTDSATTDGGAVGGEVKERMTRMQTMTQVVQMLPSEPALSARGRDRESTIQELHGDGDELCCVDLELAQGSTARSSVGLVRTGTVATSLPMAVPEGVEEAPPTLKDVCLSIPKGSLVMVVGSTGSGKSSLLAAVLGEMLPVTEALTAVSHRPVPPPSSSATDSASASSSLRAAVTQTVAVPPAAAAAAGAPTEVLGIVNQEGWVRGDSVRENVTFGKEMRVDLYQAALEAAQLAPDVRIWPEGDEKNAAELSGGQRSRVAIARLVYRRLLQRADEMAEAADDVITLGGENENAPRLTHQASTASVLDPARVFHKAASVPNLRQASMGSLRQSSMRSQQSLPVSPRLRSSANTITPSPLSFLDDPLSALDSVVAGKVFENAIRGILVGETEEGDRTTPRADTESDRRGGNGGDGGGIRAQKGTVVMTTSSHYELLPKADLIVVLGSPSIDSLPFGAGGRSSSSLSPSRGGSGGGAAAATMASSVLLVGGYAQLCEKAAFAPFLPHDHEPDSGPTPMGRDGSFPDGFADVCSPSPFQPLDLTAPGGFPLPPPQYLPLISTPSEQSSPRESTGGTRPGRSSTMVLNSRASTRLRGSSSVNPVGMGLGLLHGSSSMHPGMMDVWGMLNLNPASRNPTRPLSMRAMRAGGHAESLHGALSHHSHCLRGLTRFFEDSELGGDEEGEEEEGSSDDFKNQEEGEGEGDIGHAEEGHAGALRDNDKAPKREGTTRLPLKRKDIEKGGRGGRRPTLGGNEKKKGKDKQATRLKRSETISAGMPKHHRHTPNTFHTMTVYFSLALERYRHHFTSSKKSPEKAQAKAGHTHKAAGEMPSDCSAMTRGVAWIVNFLLVFTVAEMARLFFVWFVATKSEVVSKGEPTGPLSPDALGMPMAASVGVFAAVTALLVLMREMGWALALWRSARALFAHVSERLLRAPVSRFFDLVPAGVILNVLGRDADAVDMQVAETGSQTLQSLVASALALVVAVVAGSAWFVLAAVPLLVCFVLIFRFFRGPSKALKRLEASSRAPMVGLLEESLGGLMVIRAFPGAADLVFGEMGAAVNGNMKAFYTLWMAVRWLALRLDALAAIAVLAIGVALTFLKQSGGVSPELAGLALTTLLQLSQLLQWAARCAVDFEVSLVSVDRMLMLTKIPVEKDKEWETGSIAVVSTAAKSPSVTAHRGGDDLFKNPVPVSKRAGAFWKGFGGAGKNAITDSTEKGSEREKDLEAGVTRVVTPERETTPVSPTPVCLSLTGDQTREEKGESEKHENNENVQRVPICLTQEEMVTSEETLPPVRPSVCNPGKGSVSAPSSVASCSGGDGRKDSEEHLSQKTKEKKALEKVGGAAHGPVPSSLPPLPVSGEPVPLSNTQPGANPGLPTLVPMDVPKDQSIGAILKAAVTPIDTRRSAGGVGIDETSPEKGEETDRRQKLNNTVSPSTAEMIGRWRERNASPTAAALPHSGQMSPVEYATGVVGGGFKPASSPATKFVTADSAPALEFQNIGMRYRPELARVVSHLSAQIWKGQKVGICGRSGSGKSSLLQCLLRLVDIEEGKILLDGTDIFDLTINELRSRIAVVPQAPFLFTGTVRDNLDPSGKRSDAEILDALECAQTLEDLATQAEREGWQGGLLDLPVSDRGKRFSRGMRQMLCVARALLRRSSVVLLDEPTASVDRDTDSRLQRAMERAFAGATTLTVAHRLSTILSSDVVMVLDKGVLVEMDSPSELLSKPDSVFASLCKTQNLGLESLGTCPAAPTALADAAAAAAAGGAPGLHPVLPLPAN